MRDNVEVLPSTKLFQVAPTQEAGGTSKCMIFIDGTWLYYSLIYGRDYGCPVRDKYGEHWIQDYRINFRKIPALIAKQLEKQLARDERYKRHVDIVRTYMYTSSKAETSEDSLRKRMISDCRNANFQVTHLVTLGSQEKCVDISLAVDMLYMSSVPNAYDIAVCLTGDKDFLPAIEKTRLNAKNVVICSMRNSCNKALTEKVADFDNIWLEDHLEEFIVPRFQESYEKDLTKILIKILNREENNGSITGRNLGRALQKEIVNDQSALTLLKNKYVGVRQWLETRLDEVELVVSDETYPDFIVNLRVDDEEESISSNELMEVYTGETVTSLKEICRQKGLKVSGSKNELVERLVDASSSS